MFALIVLLCVLAVGFWLYQILDLNLNSLQRIITDFSVKKDSHWLSILFGVDDQSRRFGGELVASVLKSHGVQELFTLCGGHISPILVGAERLGLRVFDTRHEVSAVFAADAVARLRQSIGVAVVTAGPGLTNTVTAVKNAQMAESPVIIIAGAAPTLLRGRGALQDIDQISLMRPLCKSVSRIIRLRDIIPTMRKAIQIAQSNTPGPVFIEIPVDVLYPLQAVRKEFASFKNAGSFKQKMINLYLTYHISRQFGNAWVDRDLTPLPVMIPQPQETDVVKLADLLSKSRKPLLLIGSQALLPPVRADDLRFIVEKLKIPTYLGGMARGLLGHECPLQMRQKRKDALREADLIILAGSVCDFRLTYGRSLSSRAKIVCINRNYEQLTKNEGFFWRCHVKIKADVATTLLRLYNLIDSQQFELGNLSSEWLSHLKTRERLDQEASTDCGNGINPLDVLRTIDEALPDDAILVADGGDFVATASYIVHPRGPLQWLDPGAFGTLGVGGGFALGAKAVFPERPVVIIYGDGSCAFSLLEFDTFTRHKLSVIAFIGNDACWSQISREQVALFESSVAVNLKHTRYDSVGEAVGAHGEFITERRDVDREKFQKIFDIARDGTSVVANIVIGKSNFRSGSISI